MRHPKRVAWILASILLVPPAGVGAYWIWVMLNYQNSDVLRDVDAHFDALVVASQNRPFGSETPPSTSITKGDLSPAKQTQRNIHPSETSDNEQRRSPGGPRAKRTPVYPYQTKDGITRVGAVSYLVDKALFMRAQTDKARYIEGAVAQLSQRHGEPDGFVLSRIAPGTWLHAVGLRNGDVLLAVNGHRLNTAKNVSLVLANARYETRFRIDIRQNGESRSLFYKLHQP